MISVASGNGRGDHALREAAFSAAMLAITAAAAFFIGRDLWRVVGLRHDEPGRLAWEGIFLFVISVLLYGNVIFLVSRLGYYLRRHHHRPEPFEGLVSDHWADADPIVVLVPSYKEDRRTIWQTLMSAVLQHHPEKRVVLLLDDPVAPADRESRQLQAAARDMPRAIARFLSTPRHLIRQRREAFLAEAGAEGPARAADVAHLTGLQDELVRWLREQAARSDMRDHTERHFVAVTYEAHARLLAAAKRDLVRRFCDEGMSRAEVLAGIDRLRDVFAAEVTVFERKRYANLSHEPSKAANLNAYIALMGRSVAERDRDGNVHLVDAEGPDAVSIPDATFVLTLDADSMLHPGYALRLAAEFAGEGSENLAVVQTPYTAIPGAPGTLERIAGATTDMQYIVHQGFTWASATFWVGANALLRKAALDDIRVEEREGDLVVPKYIQDRTVIEDTESTVDLAAKGWELRNYPERLAFSATRRISGRC
jgi:cellulose synthase (UDP-forming)